MTKSIIFQKKSCVEGLPWLQTAWDSSSLSTYLRCPRRYFYQYICGFRPFGESVDLRFGTLVHSAMETYHIEKAHRGHNEGQIAGLLSLLTSAWEGASTQEGDQGVPEPHYWQSESNNKNLWNALRAFIWHTESFGFEPDFATAVIGKKLLGIELPFQFDLDLKVQGHQATYCGHLDRVVDTTSGRWIVDYKTTKKTVNTTYFDSYNPSTQLPGYAVAAKIVFGEPVQGVIIDAFQIGVDFVRCGRGHILLGEEKADEWLHNASAWIESAMSVASRAKIEETESIVSFSSSNAHHWPMNTESCFICPFKTVCGSTPSIRGFVLDSAFRIEHWDPLARQNQISKNLAEART